MTDTPVNLPDQGADDAAEWSDVAELPFDQVRELFNILGKALRAFQLYDEKNPVYKRFVSSLSEAFSALWNEIEGLNVSVEEHRFKLAGEEVYVSESRADSLAFLFYKDGVRDITFLPGIEGGELERLLGILQKAKTLKASEGDDLLTILWEEDLAFFKHYYVDQLVEGVESPAARPEEERPELSAVLADEIEEEESDPQSGSTSDQAPKEKPPPKIGKDDFVPTLFSLDPREKEQLRQELEAEMARDLRGDVLAALFDRLEEQDHPDRQSTILRVFRDLLPNLLSRGEVASAADILEELTALRERVGGADEALLKECDDLLDALSSAETVGELVLALEDGTIDVPVEVLSRLLSHLRANALATLLSASQETEHTALQETLRQAVRGIADQNREALVELLADENGVIASGAAHLVAELGITEAAPKLVRLMGHADASVRLAGVEAARRLGASAAAPGLINALSDSDSDVRVGAVRALAGMKYTNAAAAIKSMVQGKDIRQADLTEKISVFECFGVLGGEEAVNVLSELLNKKSLLGRREPSDIRASAARGLGRARMPKADKALALAKNDPDAVVRTAVRQALQKEGDAG